MGYHVGDRSFGIDKLDNKDEPTVLDEVLSTSEKTLDSIAAQIVATECYDEYFGIYETSSRGSSNYALVAMHEAEDLCAVDPFDVYLDRYMVTNVLKYTGIDFQTFLKFPRDRAEAILKRCDVVSSKEDTEVNDLVNSATGKKR
jgi:hypothetical protein